MRRCRTVGGPNIWQRYETSYASVFVNRKDLQQSFSVPLLAFRAKVPADGLPIYADWISTATSIWSIGFESWREAVEVKPCQPSLIGKPLEFQSIECTKGSGRVSVLLFTVTCCYLDLQKNLSVEELAEFRQPPGCQRLQITVEESKGKLRS